MTVKELKEYLNALPENDEIFYKFVERIDGKEYLNQLHIDAGYLGHFTKPVRTIVNRPISES